MRQFFTNIWFKSWALFSPNKDKWQLPLFITSWRRENMRIRFLQKHFRFPGFQLEGYGFRQWKKCLLKDAIIIILFSYLEFLVLEYQKTIRGTFQKKRQLRRPPRMKTTSEQPCAAAILTATSSGKSLVYKSPISSSFLVIIFSTFFWIMTSQVLNLE